MHFLLEFFKTLMWLGRFAPCGRSLQVVREASADTTFVLVLVGVGRSILRRKRLSVLDAAGENDIGRSVHDAIVGCAGVLGWELVGVTRLCFLRPRRLHRCNAAFG